MPAYARLVGGHGEIIVDGENGYVAHFKNPARVEKDLQRILQDEDPTNTGL